MKATGIVRRIYDLGRVVVPKEIRRTLKIREGDPLEIYTDREGEIVLKKYSPMGEIRVFAAQYAGSLSSFVTHIVVVTDRDSVVATSGGGSKLLEKPLTKQFENILEERNLYLEDKKPAKITENDDFTGQKAIMPIICEGDIIGAVVMIAKDENARVNDTELKMLAVASNFLGKQMES